MEKFFIRGGIPLHGTVYISGAKNAAVALVAATILCDEPCTLENVPAISDITKCLDILRSMGAVVRMERDGVIYIDPRSINTTEVPYKQAVTMRASSYFLGTLLGKFHEAFVPMPGGCDLGDRPIDQHLKAFRALGATDKVVRGANYVKADKLIGNQIFFDMVTVGATMNAIFASVRAKGQTIIENAAKEPHIVDVANYLNSMGADIRGAGTDVIKIRGVEYLHGTTYATIPDQIEAGTYMVAAAATKGDVVIANVIPKHLESITVKLRKCGVNVEENDESVRVWVDKPLQNTTVKTQPHPGFPTDMQPQFSTLLTMAYGTSRVTEEIFNNRFRYAAELRKMGADISIEGGKVAIIQGVDHLSGAPVQATDLRAGAALVIAGLAADGMTEIGNIHFIQRGYERIDEKLQKLGADIKRVIVPENDSVEMSG
ncbi:UDP-N-acetylglucosamine 1-carboxyvinyltransferase [Ruminococcus albus]|uniref:UDP-N-acetylglucosamine 1-carboxyvinyltransferase n=1 Tax=Ruminococcus albus 8 TaxID=246199 RepID=E9SB33_RUMAL|nr:UDP-N-acetylglucosamine 1-carboxyvinyltransferase [Ruminococcus albus]EGC03725.1 UDP-N-acetylglucosamine 1-carboxyvinyltransferase [Ruminococcus albus 8]MCC3349996.1 UDP-N-acetylglucosamine 1-carboxyvinyltransferase [Ruminococcus albus 8]